MSIRTREEKKQDRIEILLKLIKEYPDCITVNIKKLAHLSYNKNSYPLLYNTWKEIKHSIKFKMSFK